MDAIDYKPGPLEKALSAGAVVTFLGCATGFVFMHIPIVISMGLLSIGLAVANLIIVGRRAKAADIAAGKLTAP